MSKEQEGWERADELEDRAYRDDDDEFPSPPRRPVVPSLLVKVGEQRRLRREAKLAEQRRKVEELPRVGEANLPHGLQQGGGVLYPDGQGEPPSDEDYRRMETRTDPWWEDIAGPTHTPRGEGL